MPFTIAHAAAAPPLWRMTRKHLVLSALVVGSMSPDFEYLVRLSPHRTLGHTPLGVAVVCVPASLLTLAVWHRLVGPAFAGALPGGLGEAAARPFSFGPPRRFFAICASAAIGAVSHIVWDSFTHASSPVVRHLGGLRPLWPGGPSLFVIIWWGSGVVGSTLVGWWLARLARAPKERCDSVEMRPPARGVNRRMGAVVGGTAAAVAALNAVRLMTGGASPQQMVAAGVLGAMTGTALAAVAVAGAVRVGLAGESGTG